MNSGVITLTTDFGLDDHYVGAMKGVITGIAQEVPIVDICHTLQPFDILGAAFMTHLAHRHFPRMSIHVVVVDPSVGSERLPILISTDEHFFIGPDNGVFSWIYKEHPGYTAYVLDQEHYHLETDGGITFQGRDVFAPSAAWLWRKQDPTLLGSRQEELVKIDIPSPVVHGGRIEGTILQADRFGNLISNVHRSLLDEVRKGVKAKKIALTIQDKPIRAFVKHYNQVEPGVVAGLFGGSGYLEVCLRGDSAAKMLELDRGASLIVELT